MWNLIDRDDFDEVLNVRRLEKSLIRVIGGGWVRWGRRYVVECCLKGW